MPSHSTRTMHPEYCLPFVLPCSTGTSVLIKSYSHTFRLYVCRVSTCVLVHFRWLLNHDEKTITAMTCVEQIYKMTTVFTQNDPVLWICSVCSNIIFFSAWDKSRDSTAKWRIIAQIQTTLMHSMLRLDATTKKMANFTLQIQKK